MFDIPFEAKCTTSAVLCDFETIVDEPEAIVEICKFCHRKAYFNKYDGNVDKRSYANTHLRDFLQPYGAMKDLYIHIYGDRPIKDMRQHQENKAKKQPDAFREEMREYAQEEYRIASRLEGKGKL